MYVNNSTDSTYNRLQQVFCLNWLSNCAGGKTGSDASLTAFAAKCVGEVLSDPTVIGLIGPWQVVWGPQVVTAPALPFKDVAANTMFVARQTGEDGATTYVVAVAGTNPDSLYGWFGEDFDVKNTLPWTQALAGTFTGAAVNSDTTLALISAGTANGLASLFGMTDPDNAGQNFVQFLHDQIASAPPGPIEVIVSGHSLGGALSASVALWLADNQGQSSDSSLPWDPNYRAIVSAVPSAGAPPGNAVFAAHYDAVLGTRTNRLWNALDVIPHAWETDLLIQAPHLYFPYLAPNAGVLGLVDVVLAFVKSSQQTYLQINRQTAPLPGQVDIAATIIAPVSWQKLAIDEIASLVAGEIARHYGWPDATKAALAKVIVSIVAALQQVEAANHPLVTSPAPAGDAATIEQRIVAWFDHVEAAIVQDLKDLLAWLAQELGTTVAALVSFLESIYHDVKSALGDLAALVAQDLGTVLKQLTAIIGRIVQLLKTVADELKLGIADVLPLLPGILAYLKQLVIQHVPAYGQLLGVTQFTKLQTAIGKSIPYPVPS